MFGSADCFLGGPTESYLLWALQVQLDGVRTSVDIRRQLRLAVVPLGKQLLGQLDFFLFAVEALLLSFANDFLCVELDFVIAGRQVRLESSLLDHRSFANE